LCIAPIIRDDIANVLIRGIVIREAELRPDVIASAQPMTLMDSEKVCCMYMWQAAAELSTTLMKMAYIKMNQS
jgi:hypothetical protein